MPNPTPNPTPAPTPISTPTPAPTSTPACTSDSFVSGSYSTNQVAINGAFTILCDYGPAALDTPAIKVSTNAGSCTWTSWQGNGALFSCTAGSTPGTYQSTCQLVTASPNNFCPLNNPIGNISVVAAAPTPNPTAAPTPTPSSTPSIEYFGRFDWSNAAGPVFSWTGSSIRARFTGTSVTATLSGASGHSPYYFVSVIDSQTPTRFSVNSGTQTYTLASGLSSGTAHTVLLYRESESFYGTTQFLGFNFGGGGQLLAPAQTSYPNRIEFIGDSYTCGYGNMPNLDSSCPYSDDVESGYYSYANQAAILLNVPPPTIICHSGIGMVLSNGPSDAMPAEYPYTNLYQSLWTFPTNSSSQPTMVVINLGTNDFGHSPAVDPTTFTNAYINFVKNTVRKNYPLATIMVIVPQGWPQQPYLQQAVTQMNSTDRNIFFYEMPMTSNGGCHGHLSVSEDAAAAQALAGFLRGYLH